MTNNNKRHKRLQREIVDYHAACDLLDAIDPALRNMLLSLAAGQSTIYVNTKDSSTGAHVVPGQFRITKVTIDAEKGTVTIFGPEAES